MNFCWSRRTTYVLLMVLTAILGLGSRRFGAQLPGWVVLYAGDALWDLLVFWVVRWIWPQWAPAKAAAGALGFAYAVEISQLCRAPWLLAVRHTALGGLVLGHGFLWSDLVCYAAGVGLGLLLERWLRRTTNTAYC
ncbi:ribosomal maturation YjgA family protein [Hymenobacter pini]|uniref:ribosomal maturation YjgA family protein n=1 Tax=Hymenobacter pini TaxID=2880879 RepID=UPI001CF432A9|nr:DUF2809 domain-containing protein [Hymenobacter pini]MCA8830733.1 DUF2809 domain-containing protein [Hymenobacter pini]